MKKQIIALLGVGTLAYASANLTFTQTDAALTAPTNYNYSYRQSNVDIVSGNNWAIRNNGGTTLSHVPTYTQTYDGQYYDYVHSGYEIVSGLTVSHTFNNSSTSWSQVSGSTYRPNNAASYIGSNALSGTTPNKIYLKFDNQTNKNYIIYIDISSSPSSLNMPISYNNTNPNDLQPFNFGNTALNILYLPSYTYITIYRQNTASAAYFDAWYLQDLGVSASWTNGNSEGYTEGYNDGELDGYTQGYDEGYDYGVNNPPMTSLFTTAFNSISSIFNIALFGGLTLGTVIVAPIAVSLLWFILGIVSGVGGKKQ